ncbi:DNA helicase UvrD [Chryseobacterium sp. JV274]|uniref:DNA helicase UvrD n=1 Tax=Chryseobacterium sp. JV274 TaxID=1932669 RepID=UPI0015C220E7|nr:DNA helicase UvrD [Chryseobacterium sp. JV274]CAD0221528.1 DNA helicase-2/ATP-dependent DNA helicase PcrA [Chryseobacterium sp. JV274]
MDKSIILSVAGSGKTYFLVEKTNLHQNFLLITYTNSGVESIRSEVISKYGYLPNNIRVLNFFSFLYTFCYKPYLSDKYNVKGITWQSPKSIYDNGFTNKFRFLYGNRLSKLINTECIEDVKKRIEKYFDSVFIDEIQDFASSDFNFIVNIIEGNYNINLVGDFHQHTFDTSRDKNINKNLYKNEANFLKYFEQKGFNKNTDSLIKSRRCSKNVCDFIRNKLGVNIESLNKFDTEIKLLENDCEIQDVVSNNQIVKLFLTRHYNYKCNSNNWGNCKGLTFENVCVVINDEILKQFYNDKFIFKSDTTKNKFYVACSRTRGKLYFVSDKKMKIFKK